MAQAKKSVPTPKQQKNNYDPNEQFHIVNFLVYREGWEEQDKVDFKNVIVDMDLFEDLFSPTISATVTISDIGNFSGMFPLVGGEKVQFNFKMPTYDDIGSLDFVIAKIGPKNRKAVTDQFATYMIHLVTEDRYLDANKRISQAFQGTYSDIVEKILNELKSSKPLNADTSVFNQKFVAPYWTPLKCCSWIANRTVGEKYDPFVFYESLDGYNFKSLLNLYRQEPYCEIYNESGKIADDFDDTNRSWRKIIRVEHEPYGDKMKVVNTGAFGAKVYVLDTATKRIETQEYDYDSMSQVKDFAMMDKFPLYDDIDSREAYKFVVARADKSHEGAIYRNMVFNLMDFFSMKVIVPGDMNYRVGQILTVMMPGDKPDRSDDLMSGRWLIGSLRHRIIGNKYECHMQLYKDSHMVDIKKLVATKGKQVNSNGDKPKQTGTGLKSPDTDTKPVDKPEA